MKVSVLILTMNEAGNLPACLAAVDWCNDIVVLDSGSTDGTVEIARAAGARVIERPFDSFASQRNFGLEAGSLQHDWVLHLDADEIVTPAFAEALEKLAPADGVDGWRVAFRTMLHGQWLRHAGMWPTYQVRLGHIRRLRFKQVGHGQREDAPPDRLATFPEPLIHNAFSQGIERWLHKHVAYARDEALAMRDETSRAKGLFSANATDRRRAAKSLAGRLPGFLRAPARFAYVYFFRLGFLDGRQGLAYASMLATYEGMIAAFLAEQRAEEERQPFQSRSSETSRLS